MIMDGATTTTTATTVASFQPSEGEEGPKLLSPMVFAQTPPSLREKVRTLTDVTTVMSVPSLAFVVAVWLPVDEVSDTYVNSQCSGIFLNLRQLYPCATCDQRCRTDFVAGTNH